jgi:hypothetical protein
MAVHLCAIFVVEVIVAYFDEHSFWRNLNLLISTVKPCMLDIRRLEHYTTFSWIFSQKFLEISLLLVLRHSGDSLVLFFILSNNVLLHPLLKLVELLSLGIGGLHGSIENLLHLRHFDLLSPSGSGALERRLAFVTSVRAQNFFGLVN